MKDVIIKDVKRKTNLDRKVLEQAAILGYATLAKNETTDDELVLNKYREAPLYVKDDENAYKKNRAF
jgi:hypothetical protein